ncbi:DUF4232 domain-containing protein [Nocardia stercoris]|uniref:DUF4232 domain-containing protein n=1 Tax=Nocardia stercoris TaxID=2483361 RepID=A0A3M2L737_9NOCA|nr:DUF4232 domain-containing protein [Nocardia stercoris]RMI30348.1 DUF4232 domain-containing protein [Nocardia stercoris]
MTRYSTTAVLLALAGTFALTGCEGDIPSSGPTTVTVVTGAAAPTGTGGSPGSTGTPTANGAAPQTAGGTPVCRTAQLTLSQGDNGGDHGGMGTFVAQLIFTNTGPAACVMQGYAGVSQTVGATGDPVGAPADRDTSSLAKVVPVTLAPGGAAQFLLFTSNWQNYPDTCAPKSTDHLRVYPPDNTDSLALPWDRKICTGPMHLLTVRPVQPM